MTTPLGLQAPRDITPAFIRWTLAYTCPLREFEDPFDPDRTDRLLRSAYCYSDAVGAGRVAGGVAVPDENGSSGEQLGFAVEPALAPLGGLAYVQQLCTRCEANALLAQTLTALAGCVGYVSLPSINDEAFHTHFERACAGVSGFNALFPHTSPRWFGLWWNEQFSKDQAAGLVQLASELLNNGPALVGFTTFIEALRISIERGIPLVWRSYPAGWCEGRAWHVEAHCDRCKATWPEAKRQQCSVCGQVGHRQAEQTRKRMGIRPYRPLREFLTAEEQVALLRTLQEQRKPPDQS